MDYETKMTKGLHGWKATTEIKLEDVAANADAISPEAGERILRLSTSKGYNGVSSTASVFKRVEHQMDGRTYCSEQHAVGMGTKCGDYYRTIKKHDVKRVTEKALLAAHDEALQQWPALIEEAKAFYANKAEG